MLPENFRLHRDHLCVNISLPENDNGIINLNRDPRKQRIKPDVYVGVVEDVGPGCAMVKVGDKVCLERWEYGQWNVDDQRLIAREIDILVLGEKEPAPGVVVMKLLNQQVKTNLTLPQNAQPKKASYYCGIVQCSGNPDVEPGEIVYVPRREDFQYRLGADRLVFRTVDENSILLKLVPEFKMEELVNG